MEGHLLRVPDTDDVKQKNKNHKTIPSKFFSWKENKEVFFLRHLCQLHELWKKKNSKDSKV